MKKPPTEELAARALEYSAKHTKFSTEYASLAIDFSERVELEMRRAFLEGALVGFELARRAVVEQVAKQAEEPPK